MLLRLLETQGEIRDLELQPRFDIHVEGQYICHYKADFRYLDGKTGRPVIEDVKGVKTDVYKLKKKLVEAIYPFRIVEV